MKIDDLIVQLKEIRKTEGNIEVVYDAGEDEERVELLVYQGRLLIQGKSDYWF